MTAATAAQITAIGMTTPVGLTAAQSCAAVRAGISAMAELDVYLDTDGFEDVAVMGCAIEGLTDGYFGLARATRLATAALKDLTDSAKLSRQELATAALYLALPPSSRGPGAAQVGQLLGARIAEWRQLPGIERRVRVYASGHAAAAQACQDACLHIAQGVVERVIVCGVDSLVEADVIEFFLSKRRLKTDDNVDGFIPGEAGACLLIESADTADARGAVPLATIEAAATAIEPMTIWADAPSQGTGLSDAIAVALDTVPDRGHQTRVVVCDLNGETYRAKEFGNAAARALSAIPGKLAIWHPADCIGDTGAAAFAVSACVAAKALDKGYAKGEAVIVLGSSDDGLRGAVSLRRVRAEV